MNVNRTTIFAALLAAGLASGAIAQSTAPSTPSKSSTAAGSTATPATPAPPSAGSTGMDKGAGTAAPAPEKTTSGAKSTATKSSTAPSLAAGERRFLEKAAQAGKAEIEISKLALQKAENPKAKEFAQRMIDDHTKAAAELEKLASAKGVTLPNDMDGGHKRLLDKLSKKSGNAFDREYTDEMEDDHSKVVRDFRSMAKSAKDADVKAFAAKTLPTLEQHLQLAKDAESAVKSAGRKTTAATSTSTTTPPSTAKSTAAPAKDTTAAPATPPSTPTSATAPPASGSASDTKSTSPTK